MSLTPPGAQLTPTLRALVAAWVPDQPWARAPLTDELVGSFRFADPDGEVDIETHLVRTADGRVLQVPVTHRPEPLENGDFALLGTVEHPELGTRWVYDGCADPVYFAALCTTILAGGHESAPHPDDDAPRVHVRGSGGVITDGTAVDATVPMQRFDAGGITAIDTGVLQVGVQRAVGEGAPDDGSRERGPTLTGIWPGVDEPVLLAFFRPGLRRRR
ncbi:maltokinase N-terminal cap-like domain-containing protein [Pseudonocardia sp. CA-107938]|uniref:maltokinase N-terminal cap-like domain-containing protein n=1 Tax=Pseudonocardia sp. CA-107938 TaxID=3240021 RepID=UPI003D9102A4